MPFYEWVLGQQLPNPGVWNLHLWALGSEPKQKWDFIWELQCEKSIQYTFKWIAKKRVPFRWTQTHGILAWWKMTGLHFSPHHPLSWAYVSSEQLVQLCTAVLGNEEGASWNEVQWKLCFTFLGGLKLADLQAKSFSLDLFLSFFPGGWLLINHPQIDP